MSETYLITAKTVEEAIAIANSEYADEKHEISYDIIDMPKKGFLGIGAKPAKIKVTVTESVSADLGSLVDDIRGMKSLTSRGDDDRKNNKQKNNKDKKNDQKKNDNKPAEKPAAKAAKAEDKPADKPAEKKQGGLSNQVKKKQRQDYKPSSADEIVSSGVTVAAPIGISDFKTEAKADFGSGKSSGRISNDIKKKKKNAPAASAAPAAPAAPAAVERPAEKPKADRASENTSKKHRPLEEAEKLREAVTEAEMEYALEFINKLLSNMKLTATAEAVPAPEGEEYIKTEVATVYPKINIVGDDTGILIGHHGETLDAIQYLANLSAIRRGKQSEGDYVKIVLDIENYREKREETLRTLARRMANKAIKYKRNVFLEPMNAYERHIIHSELHSVENVSTHSVGSDRDRKIIITYEGADKQSDNRRRRRRGGEKRENLTTEKAESTEKTSEHKRRPRKIQKMPIEKLPDFLASAEDEPEKLSEIEY